MQTYEFRENHTDNTTSATYYTDRDCIYLDEWFGRSFADFSRGMQGRGFRYRKEETNIAGRKWTSHLWEK